MATPLHYTAPLHCSTTLVDYWYTINKGNITWLLGRERLPTYEGPTNRKIFKMQSFGFQREDKNHTKVTDAG